MPAVASIPVWTFPNVQEKVRKVKAYIYHTLAKKNLFAWRDFVEELSSDMEAFIYSQEQLIAAGELYVGKGDTRRQVKDLGAGAYCRAALQGALNYASWASALKRRLNYESISLDAILEVEGGGIQLQVADNDTSIQESDLYMSIEMQFGKEIYALAQRVLNGENIGAAELRKLRTPEMLALLK